MLVIRAKIKSSKKGKGWMGITNYIFINSPTV